MPELAGSGNLLLEINTLTEIFMNTLWLVIDRMFMTYVIWLLVTEFLFVSFGVVISYGWLYFNDLY